MLSRRQPQLPFAEGARSPALAPRIWTTRDIVAVARSACLYSEFNRSGVPYGHLRSFITMQLARVTPYEVTGSHVELSRRHVRIWFWNQTLLLSALKTKPSANALVVPETLLQSSNASLRACALGGFEGSTRDKASDSLRLQWWPKAPSTEQWARLSTAGLPRPSPPSWYGSVPLHTWAFAKWWHAHERFNLQATPWTWALSGVVVVAVAAWAGLHAAQNHFAERDRWAMLETVQAARHSAGQQLAAQQSLADSQDKSRGLDRFKGRRDLADGVACIALAVSGSGVRLRDLDVRAGAVQAQLGSSVSVELLEVQRAIESCELLIDGTVEPTGDPKTVRLSGRLSAPANSADIVTSIPPTASGSSLLAPTSR